MDTVKMAEPSENDQQAPDTEDDADPGDAMERALDIVGFGRYSLRCCLLIAFLLVSSLMEVIGTSIVMPAAKCDLNVCDETRGIISAIPFIGMLLTGYFHGYLIDTQGRRKVALYATLAAGCTSFCSTVMPNLISFVLMKFLSSLCIVVPSALPYTLIGEILPAKHRDLMMSISNSIQLLGSALVSFLAWIIIPFDFGQGPNGFRSWRLLAMIYSLFLLLSAFVMYFVPESPKFLYKRGEPEAALKVLKTMYAGNKRKSPEDFPIKSLPKLPKRECCGLFESLKVQTMPFTERRYHKYLLINGSMLYGVYFISNGVYLWVVDIINRVMIGDSHDKTACQVIKETAQLDQSEAACDDTVDEQTLLVSFVAQMVFAAIGIGFSVVVNRVGKRILIIGCFFTMGVFCILVNFVTNDFLFIMLTAFPLLVLAIGPINAYSLQVFPTTIRGMAVLLCMMLGRIGSLSGSVITGLMIKNACNLMFYSYAVLLFICGSMALLHK